VGGQYENAAGRYDVLGIDGGTVRIRYANGFEMNLPERGLWAQWEQLIAERTGRPLVAPKPATVAKAPTARPAPGTRSSTSRASTPREPALPKPKKGASGEAAFYTSVGYVAAGCEIVVSVAGRDYPAFAQRYKILTGRNLVTPHEGLDVHERPTHRMGADLSLLFPADANTRSYLDFGKDAPIEPADEPGQYRVTRTDTIERLLRLGFDLGTNNTPAAIRANLPEVQQINFDRGISLRRMLRR
jgi:hypothetical protein